MVIYTVRHGQTDNNKKNLLTGMYDIPINEIGISQAQKLKTKIQNIKFDKVISSDLKRAQMTAKIITDDKYDIVLSKNLRERFYGNIENKLVNNIKDYWNIKNNINSNNVETMIEFLNRIFIEMDEIIKKYNNLNNILIVSHHGTCMAIDAYFSDKYNYNFDNFILDNCEYKKYKIKTNN